MRRPMTSPQESSQV